MKRSRRSTIVGASLAVLVAVFAVAAYATSAITVGPNEIQASAEKEVNRDVPNSASNAHVPSSGVPRPATVAVDGATPGLATSVVGLNHFAQRTADGGNQFSLEPPDQGFCVGGSTAIEAVNDVFATYPTGGGTPSAATSLTTFFTGQHQIVRHATVPATATYGPFLSDPKCYYDPQDNRFFLTILRIDQDSVTGAFGTHSAELIAVSRTATPSTDPSQWWFYSIDTSNHVGNAVDTVGGVQSGSRILPSHPGCPCFGDQPLIGADQNGFYITSNEFSIAGSAFNGAQVYAFDKTGLENGTLKMQYVAGRDAPLPLAEGPAYSLQPATSPTLDDWSGDSFGTEYLLSALDFNATLDNRIAAWALTNTSSLKTATPNVHISSVVVPSEVYGQPPDAEQKAGSIPLAGVVEQINGAKNAGSGTSAKEELLAGNDDRMNQAVYAGGKLWGAVNTAVKTDNGPSHVGSAYFVVSPSVTADQVAATITGQGYVAVNGQNLLYPAIGVTHDGKAVYTATLVGPDYFPSAVYATIDPTASGPSAVHVAAAGLGPDDGFTGYPPFGGPTARWGDYSAAVADTSGNVWLATEYIGQTCTVAQFAADQTCGGTRTINANWGTSFFEVATTP
jgi:hypothetical protein